ncbi:MAG: hypothetical protein WC781_02440 [Candidatus Pacearchaeota archaeon]|jgi:hypothetical protein
MKRGFRVGDRCVYGDERDINELDKDSSFYKMLYGHTRGYIEYNFGTITSKKRLFPKSEEDNSPFNVLYDDDPRFYRYTVKLDDGRKISTSRCLYHLTEVHSSQQI